MTEGVVDIVDAEGEVGGAQGVSLFGGTIGALRVDVLDQLEGVAVLDAQERPPDVGRLVPQHLGDGGPIPLQGPLQLQTNDVAVEL